MTGFLNPFTTGNPFLGTKSLGFSIGRDSGALKGLTQNRRNVVIFIILALLIFILAIVLRPSMGLVVGLNFQFAGKKKGGS